MMITTRQLGLSLVAFVALTLASINLSISQDIDVKVGTVTTPSPTTEEKALVEHLATKYDRPIPLVQRIVKTAYREAKQAGLSPLLVLAVIEKESSLKPDVVNHYGAVGLMQVVPRFHKDLMQGVLHPNGLLNPETNIRTGVRILSTYVSKSNGNEDKALKVYSGNARDYGRRVHAYKFELEQVVYKNAAYIAAKPQSPTQRPA